jgi:hypothetical protein
MNKTILIIGIIVLIVGVAANIFTSTTTQSHMFGMFSTSSTTAPYAVYSFPLIVGGIILIIVGFALKEGKK